jgi:hypothetical protein
MSKNPLYRYTLKCNSIGYDELLGDGFNLGTVVLSVADGYAMLYDSGQDFSRFSLASGVTNKGSRRYQVYAFEGSDVITGFLDLCSSGESLGSELRGDASVYPEFYATWSSAEGRLSLHDWSGGHGVFTMSCTTGKLYKLTFKAAQEWGIGGRYYNNLTITFGSRSWTVDPYQAAGEITYETEYNSYTYYLTAPSASPTLDFYKPSGWQGHIHAIWDISFKEVVAAPITRGIKVYDAQVGGSQNWCGGLSNIASGFNYESAALTYKIIPLF